jgi:DNA-directed RNA polymerase subunit E'/Rpb7
MSIDISTPIKSKLQYTRIMIPPHMMNSDIEDNMMIVLQQKVENKCNRYGFIQKVHYIEKYEEDLILSENFSGNAPYNITYMSDIMIPIENTIIVGTVKALNPELAIIVNGPIIVFIPKANIDTNIWDVSNEFTDKKNRTILKQDDYVKVHLDKVKINQGDVQIKCIGKLMGRANDEEIEMVYGTKAESNFM